MVWEVWEKKNFRYSVTSVCYLGLIPYGYKKNLKRRDSKSKLKGRVCLVKTIKGEECKRGERYAFNTII